MYINRMDFMVYEVFYIIIDIDIKVYQFLL